MKTVVSMPADAQAQTERVAQAASRPAKATQPHSAFAPVLLCVLALLLGLGWQSYQLVAEREGMQAAHAGQQQTVDNAGKLRASLDALAADTQRLADSGNASAAALVAELRKRGITINPQAAAAAAAASAAAPR